MEFELKLEKEEYDIIDFVNYGKTAFIRKVIREQVDIGRVFMGDTRGVVTLEDLVTVSPETLKASNPIIYIVDCQVDTNTFCEAVKEYRGSLANDDVYINIAGNVRMVAATVSTEKLSLNIVKSVDDLLPDLRAEEERRLRARFDEDCQRKCPRCGAPMTNNGTCCNTNCDYKGVAWLSRKQIETVSDEQSIEIPELRVRSINNKYQCRARSPYAVFDMLRDESIACGDSDIVINGEEFKPVGKNFREARKSIVEFIARKMHETGKRFYKVCSCCGKPSYTYLCTNKECDSFITGDFIYAEINGNTVYICKTTAAFEALMNAYDRTAELCDFVMEENLEDYITALWERFKQVPENIDGYVPNTVGLVSVNGRDNDALYGVTDEYSGSTPAELAKVILEIAESLRNEE